MGRHHFFCWLRVALVASCCVAQLAQAQLQCPGAEQVSIGLGTTAPDFASQEPAVPPTGDSILFSSRSTNLSTLFIPGTSSNSPNIYRYSPTQGIELISVNTNGTAPQRANNEDLSFGCLAPSVSEASPSGAYAVAFHSDAVDLIVGFGSSASGTATNVYLRLPKIGRTMLISSGSSDNTGANNSSDQATVALISQSPETYRVCFSSSASNLVAQESGQKIYCREVTVVNGTPSLGAKYAVKEGNVDGDLLRPALSADGKVLAFQSTATIVAGKPKNQYFQVYSYTFATEAFRLLSASAAELPATGNSIAPSLSRDGSAALFTYEAPKSPNVADLKGFERTATSIVVKQQVATGVNSRVNVNAAGTPTGGEPHTGRIDSSGRYAVFSEVASGTGEFFQVYLKDLSAGDLVRTSVNSANQAGNQDSGRTGDSAAGLPLSIGHRDSAESSPFVSFLSVASNLASVGVPDSNPDSLKPFIFRSIVATPTPTPTPTPRVLTKNIRITEPPDVNVLGKDANGQYAIEVVCEKFALNPSLIKDYPDWVELLASKKARLTYAVEIRKAGSSRRITRISSRNVVTVRKLSPGGYTVRYRVTATKGNKKIQSRMSPRATITLS